MVISHWQNVTETIEPKRCNMMMNFAFGEFHYEECSPTAHIWTSPGIQIQIQLTTHLLILGYCNGAIYCGVVRDTRLAVSRRRD